MRRTFVVVTLLCTGCAAGAPPAMAPAWEERDPELAELTRHEDELRRARAGLQASAVGATDRCEERLRLSSVVCEAAAGICRIAARRPELQNGPPRCAEAERACAEGRAAVADCAAR